MALDRKAILKLVTPAVIDQSTSREAVTSAQENRDYKSEIQLIDIQNRRAKQALRDTWERLLRWLVLFGFVLSYVTIFLIGTNVIRFPSNAFAVPSVVAVGIAQTYGLAKLAVSYFFSEDGKSEG